MNHQHDPRKKRRGPDIPADGKQELIDRIFAQIEKGEKPSPPKKNAKPEDQWPARKRYRYHERGTCSGCRRELLKAPDGRIFHRAGVYRLGEELCPYGTFDYQEEPDYGNHSMTVTIGGFTRSLSFFSYEKPVLNPAVIDLNVPEWAFFGRDLLYNGD